MSSQAAYDENNRPKSKRANDRFWYWAVASLSMMAAFGALALWADRPGRDYGLYLADFSVLVPGVACMFIAIPITAGLTALSGIRSQQSRRWLTSIIVMFGLVLSLAATYVPVLGKLVYGGVFSGWTRYQVYVGDKVIRLGIQPAGDYSASWYDVYECVGGGLWCRRLGSVSADAIDQGRLPDKVALQVDEGGKVSVVLADQVVATYQDGVLACADVRANRCQ